jgi:flagellar motor switch/type III secretory pathway protein FliN
MPFEQKGLAKLQYEGSYFAQVRLNHNTIKFLDFNPLPDEVSMEQHGESPLKSLSEVSLELQVEFAKINLNFSEFEKLTSGQTLEIAKDNPTSCYLTLQGQRVAKGELVKVGEQMAFLIEELKS